LAPCDHILQLFDDAESLADGLAEFLRSGFERNETMLVLAGAAQWSLTVKRFVSDADRLSNGAASGQLTLLDSITTLERLRPGGRLNPVLFDEVVGTLVRQLRSRGRPLRVYGEMVDVLALEGDFQAARQLEDLWNDLGCAEPFTLLCGYSAVHFGDPASADALARICRSHSEVRVSPHDILATFLLETANPGIAT
jgi:hypothetical protein